MRPSPGDRPLLLLLLALQLAVLLLLPPAAFLIIRFVGSGPGLSLPSWMRPALIAVAAGFEAALLVRFLAALKKVRETGRGVPPDAR